jgi:hypothetical protein
MMRAFAFQFERLEPRTLLAGDVLTYHNDAFSTGQNLTETVLTPTNISAALFGKIFTSTLDGQVYAQPLFKTNVRTTRGTNPGVHNVLFAATQHDSLYAIDANTGQILWQDSFLNITDPRNLTPTTGVTPIGANSTVNDVVNIADVNPEIGILSTPVIDPNTNVLYLVAATKEFRGSDRHFVQRLWALNIADGSVALGGPRVIADTLKNTSITNTSTRYINYQYFDGPIVNGTGNNGGANLNADGWDPSTDPNHLGYSPSASGQIAFNALLQMGRPGVTLLNGTIYLGFASHGDNGPYYGWILSYRASDLALSGAFVTTPTYKGIVGDRPDFTAQGGVWMSGNRLSSDGTFLYFTTGNGAFDEANSNFDSSGFPIDHNYADCLVKLGIDPFSSPTNQNGNGWGLKVYDYFTPSNQLKLNQIDADLGSGGVTLLPDNAANIPGHPHLLITGGKEGRIYLIDRDNMGKFNLTYPKNAVTAPYPDPRLYDRTLGEFQTNATNSQTHKDYGTPAYFNGKFFIAVSGDPGRKFSVGAFASGTIPPGTFVPPVEQQTSFIFGTRGPTQAISANGTSNAVIWGLSNNVTGVTDNLIAYNVNTYTNPAYDTNTNPGRDSLVGTVSGARGVKFSVPTVINGMVYCGTGGINATNSTIGLGTIVGYGLLSPTLGTPSDLTAEAQAPRRGHLTWTRNNTIETGFQIERSLTSTGGFEVVGYAPNGATSYDDRTIAPSTRYYYRIAAISGPSISGYSNVAVMWPSQVVIGDDIVFGPPPRAGMNPIGRAFGGSGSSPQRVIDLLDGGADELSGLV